MKSIQSILLNVCVFPSANPRLTVLLVQDCMWVDPGYAAANGKHPAQPRRPRLPAHGCGGKNPRLLRRGHFRRRADRQGARRTAQARPRKEHPHRPLGRPRHLDETHQLRTGHPHPTARHRARRHPARQRVKTNRRIRGHLPPRWPNSPACQRPAARSPSTA